MTISIRFGSVSIEADTENVSELRAAERMIASLCDELEWAPSEAALSECLEPTRHVDVSKLGKRRRRRRPGLADRTLAGECPMSVGREPPREPQEAPTVAVDTGRRKERETLDAVRELGHASPSDVARKLGINPPAASARLRSLMANGFLRLVKIGVYELMPPEDE